MGYTVLIVPRILYVLHKNTLSKVPAEEMLSTQEYFPSRFYRHEYEHCYLAISMT